MSYKLNRILNVEKFNWVSADDNAYAFFRMMETYMGEFDWETLVENPDDIYFTTPEQTERVPEEIERFCLDSILGRHEKDKVSALWFECDEENDGCTNIEDSFVDMGNGTVHIDSYDWEACDYWSEAVMSVYDEETAMTYVMATKESDTPEFTLLEVGRYNGKPNDELSDLIVKTTKRYWEEHEE